MGRAGVERNEKTQEIGKINREGDGGEVVSLARQQVIETELIGVHERVHLVEVEETWSKQLRELSPTHAQGKGDMYYTRKGWMRSQTNRGRRQNKGHQERRSGEC